MMYVLHNYSYVDYVLGKHTEYSPALTYISRLYIHKLRMMNMLSCAQTHFQHSTILRGVQGREWVW